MSDGSYFVNLSILAFACCASRPSLENEGSDTGGVVVADLGVDVEVAGAEEVFGTDEAASIAEAVEAGGGVSDCSGGSSTTLYATSLCRVMSMS